jgi:hypothetical protein
MIVHMKIGSFTKDIFIETDVSIVMDAISDYTQQHHFHPLIVKIEQATTVPAGILKRYAITDRLFWGPFRFNIRYRADIISITADAVHTEAYQFPGTYISLISTVKSTKGGTLLSESFTLKSPGLFFGYAFRQAEKAHRETLDRLKEYIEKAKPR